MSFEGYYKVLCQKGHLATFDVYHQEPEDFKCSICQTGSAWSQIVDQTNGYDPLSEYPLVVDKEAVTETCPHCHGVKELEPVRYKIPTREEETKWRNERMQQLEESEYE